MWIMCWHEDTGQLTPVVDLDPDRAEEVASRLQAVAHTHEVYIVSHQPDDHRQGKSAQRHQNGHCGQRPQPPLQ